MFLLKSDLTSFLVQTCESLGHLALKVAMCRQKMFLQKLIGRLLLGQAVLGLGQAGLEEG
jgi:hypothetical protein